MEIDTATGMGAAGEILPTIINIVEEAPPAFDPVDDDRDMSGDAITTSEMLRGKHAFAQCTLSAVRNLLRDEQLPRSFLANRQVAGCAGTSEQPEGEIRFPDWLSILQPLCHSTDELVVGFDPTSIGLSELMHDVRLMACSYAVTTHVVTIIRHGALVGGRVAFRKYDNDSHARRRGTYELTNARRLWVRCTMIAITTENSALHRAVEASRARTRESVDICSPPRHARR